MLLCLGQASPPSPIGAICTYNPLSLEIFNLWNLNFFQSRIPSNSHIFIIFNYNYTYNNIINIVVIIIIMIRSASRGCPFSEDHISNNNQRFETMQEPSSSEPEDDNFSIRFSSVNPAAILDLPINTGELSSPCMSPYAKSPWSSMTSMPPLHPDEDGDGGNNDDESFVSPCKLMGSLVREEGHVYSLAASKDLLYTGSDSKNIRVWKNQKEFSGFKSHSGLVKAIVIAGEKIFSGHQDGKVRVWRISRKSPSLYRRVGTLPTLRDCIMCSLRPSNYVEVRRHKSSLWIRHYDAISCLSLSEDKMFLYSASWDKTFKVWRVSDSKCLESIKAHDDAVNSLVAGFDGLVFTGSADGTVKVWRRELQGKGTKHFFSQTLLKQECAVTALAVNPEATVVYCGSSDGLVNFWERDKHLQHGGVLRGHKLAVLCLATAGTLVFSGSADAGICVWRRDGNAHICLTVLTGHSGPVKCLAIEEDMTVGGERRQWILYSGSLDKSVKMWNIKP